MLTIAGSKRLTGICLFGNGCPVSGSRIGDVARLPAGREVSPPHVVGGKVDVRSRGDVVDERPLPPGEEERAVHAVVSGQLHRPAEIPAVLLALQLVAFDPKNGAALNVMSRRYPKPPPWIAVRPRARHGVDDGAGLVAGRRAVVARLNRELLQRFRERERLVLLEVRIVVARAVEAERNVLFFRSVRAQAKAARNRLA